MILGLITLLTALSISGIAAYYSIVGLTAIFAAAVMPIIVMGAVLELGKVVTTLWLHYNWERAEWKIKSYLIAAVVILMLITSMGIFGFLSKAHLDQAVPSGDIMAQVALFDEKIKTQRDNIDSTRKVLAQMDSAVDQLMSRSTDETGAQRSANLRKSQQKEKAKLQQEIDVAQKEITKLQEQRSPIATQLRKVEAEVGPIKYIAALIYGDQTNQNMLEAAVRWVIIIIVLVFDPLAIVLILAATTSMDWAKRDRAKRKLEEAEKINLARQEALVESEKAEKYEDYAKAISDAVTLAKAESELEFEKTRAANEEKINAVIDEKTKLMDDITNVNSALTGMVAQTNELTELIETLKAEGATAISKQESLESELTSILEEYDVMLAEKATLETKLEKANTVILDTNHDMLELSELAARSVDLQQELTSKEDEITALRNKISELTTVAEVIPVELPVIEQIIDPVIEPEVTQIEEPEVVEMTADSVATIAEATESPTQFLPKKNKVEMDLSPQADNFPMGGNASFGTQFPVNPLRGDLFLRVDFLPSKLFKWVGSRWIEIDKTNTDTYVFNEEYVKLLVDKVSNNEYDIDDLSSIEQEQVAQYLINHPAK